MAKRWYSVSVLSNFEKKVAEQIRTAVEEAALQDDIDEILVPTEEVIEVRRGKKVSSERRFMPGYVLVRMELNDESWAAVRHTPSVTGFVGHGQQPVALSIDEVLNMLTPSVIAKVNAAQAGAAVARKKKIEVVDFAVGDSVMVVDGPFTGVHATITELNPNNQRLIALVEILGRETPVDLEFKQVEKVV